MAYNANDLAKFIAKVINENNKLQQEIDKNYIQFGVVREGGTVEVAGTVYPASFDCVDDHFSVGQGVKVAFLKNTDRVVVIGR
jgi:hypothetical protein